MRTNKSKVTIYSSEELHRFLKEHPNIVFSATIKNDFEGAVYLSEFDNCFYVTEEGTIQNLMGYASHYGIWERHKKMTKNMQYYINKIRNNEYQKIHFDSRVSYDEFVAFSETLR